MMRRRSLGTLLGIQLICASCQQHLSTDCALETWTPTEYKTKIQESTAQGIDAFWEVYGDDELDTLVEVALEQNHDIRTFYARWQQLRALARSSYADRWPQIFFTPYLTKNQQLTSNTPSRRMHREYGLPLDLEMDLDLFGKLYHLNCAAIERSNASHFDLLATRLFIAAEVCKTYFSLRTLDEEIRFLEEAVEVRKVLRAINAERVRVGLDPEIDLSRAELELATTQQELEDTSRVRTELENALAVLIGVSASELTIAKGQLPELPPPVPQGVPSDILYARPDIQKVTHEVARFAQEVGAAKADFFPQLSLTGALGAVSPQLSELCGWPSRFWSFGLKASQLVFDAHKTSSQTRAAKARYQESIESYQQTVVKAFREVEDALNAVHYRKMQTESQEKAVAFSEKTAYLARNQYTAGLINYLQVADAEKTELENRQQFIRLKGTRYLAQIDLVQALGCHI